MADDDSSSTSDESIDISSNKFDPIKAIYSTKLRLPSTSAPLYDNVCMFESRMKNLNRGKKSQTGSDDVAKAKEYAKQRLISNQGSTEDDSKKKITTKGRGRKCREVVDVLTKMPKILGPLGLLYQCMETRKRIRVYTRNECGIRGHVEAYVAAFDKHWNLALEDCFEVWTRKCKRKTPAALAGCGDITDNENITRIARQKATAAIAAGAADKQHKHIENV
ncbi:PREDICTED: U7 snRNA-associated Sm-like protein LSm11 [Polistes dominula]|uniref:U7 snRNA-associated Sm-like protein LSm11 n=1 Tax=Polistes dominula TaxID=743375 RepID=A0ABM1IR39_POLDO|nr:PREDICTED: U7 snRNA-associated Sm-like protein LSm11 [Polistes dominula]